MKDHNNEKIKEMLGSAEVPEEISPENIKKMLDSKAPSKKRNKIKHIALRVTAGAAACAVVAGTTVYFTEQRNENKFDESDSSEIYIAESENSGSSEKPHKTKSVMKSASDYGDIYRILRRNNVKDYFNGYSFTEKDTANKITGVIGVAAAEDGIPEAAPSDTDMVNQDSNKNDDNNDAVSRDHSDTYNQEENVLEADIVKTDGECIYMLCNGYDSDDSLLPYLNIASVNNGHFTGSSRLNIADTLALETSEDYESSVSVNDMYIYNDMAVVIGTFSQYYTGDLDEEEIYNGSCDCLCGGWYDCDTSAFVNVYTTGLEPELICSYTQDGQYCDVRITEDGSMYLVTDYNSASYWQIKEEENFTEYIPEYSINGKHKLIPAGSIMLPPDGYETTGDLPYTVNDISYTVVGGLDLSQSGTVKNIDIKAVSGYSSTIYCTSDNLYLTWGWNATNITRLALDSGTITAAAVGKVDGRIKDQFSMSEYDGYFRIAATVEKYDEKVDDSETSAVFSRVWTGTDNIVYVLDSDLKEVGKIDGIGEGETIKSVNFSGNIGYVVTYEQTDPLFAIDLSNPRSPKMLDDYELLGYSTYMQQWSDGELLGFGVYADEKGIEDGVKIVMFDNSDPNNLGELASCVINKSGDDYLYSDAVWERKALLIAPEKNIIGFPLIHCNYGKYDREVMEYLFYSYENGEFVKRGSIKAEDSDCDPYDSYYQRALYIGDYVYLTSAVKFVSADIATMTVTDDVKF